MHRVLFVCLGNICRSPTAHGVFRQAVIDADLQDRFEIESAGTGDWHLGKAPDPRAQAQAAARGIDISDLRARAVFPEDFDDYDHILAMDAQNLADLKAMQPVGSRAKVSLFLDHLSGHEGESVPDPYYGGEEGFQTVYALVEATTESLLKQWGKA
ncbi:Low molecular weight phosphotyrosine protein phosphatase [gamma proteobacterium HTCC5015]|nr:Low molecular weight phosphotyrosine protein phosphatase [gamma proteobacterium HTCC5015]